MEPKSSHRLLSTIRISVVLAILMATSIFVFTNRVIYGIIFSTAAVLAILGFMLMIRLFDRCVRSGKSAMLVVVSIGKLLVAGVVLVILGRHSMMAVFCFAAGILVVTGAVMVEAVFRLLAGLSHGRT